MISCWMFAKQGVFRFPGVPFFLLWTHLSQLIKGLMIISWWTGSGVLGKEKHEFMQVSVEIPCSWFGECCASGFIYNSCGSAHVSLLVGQYLRLRYCHDWIVTDYFTWTNAKWKIHCGSPPGNPMLCLPSGAPTLMLSRDLFQGHKPNWASETPKTWQICTSCCLLSLRAHWIPNFALIA